MQKRADGTTIFTKTEVHSLLKAITAWTNTIASFPSSGEDLFGAENYYAMGMWEDKLAGRKPDLSWYLDDEDNAEFTTVDVWLDAYGRGML